MLNTYTLPKLIFFLLLFMNIAAISQVPVNGPYFFRRQEMASGFNFSEGSKFEFFYSYGAVDRSARGTFLVAGDTVKLRSDKQGGKDFTVTKQSKQGTGYTLRFEDRNAYLLAHISCVFVVDGKEHTVQTDSKGIAKINTTRCDKIYVRHELYPDVPTVIKEKANSNNNFTMTLNPSLEQVSFKFLYLIIAGDSLKLMPSYFLPMTDIAFAKEQTHSN